MKSRVVLAGLVLLVAVSLVRADIPVPGTKRVSHILKFVNIADHSDYIFYIFPRDLYRGKNGNTTLRVNDAGEVTISGINPLAYLEHGVHLFAVPKKLVAAAAAPDEAWFNGKTPGVLKSNRLVDPIRGVPSSDKRTKIVTKYEIRIKDGLQATAVKDDSNEEPSESGSAAASATQRWHIALGGVFAAFAAGSGLWLVLRRRV